MSIPLFIHQDIKGVREALGEQSFQVCIDCSAGVVGGTEPENYVRDFQRGAEELFSIGQPVFDENGNLMGYLGLDLWEHLNYATDGQYHGIKIPVERWRIFCATDHCKLGKKIILYWQKWQESNERRGEECQR